jgi:magnesium-transporting ATPase (P-type)
LDKIKKILDKFFEYKRCPNDAIIKHSLKEIYDIKFRRAIMAKEFKQFFDANYNSKLRHNLTKNLTYSFKYKSITYEYDEIANQIIPVYMNLLNLTCKDIFHYFGEGLSSEGIVKIFQNRYGKNEYVLNFNMAYLYFHRIELPHLVLVMLIGIIELILTDYISFFAKLIIVILLLLVEYVNTKLTITGLYNCENTLDGEKIKIRAKRNYKFDPQKELFCKIDNCDLLPGDIIFLKSNDIVPCDCLIMEGECMANSNIKKDKNKWLIILQFSQNFKF